MSLVEKVIGYFSPELALRRARARTTLSNVRAYEGASRSDGWRVRRAGASANTDHMADARELRNRARSLVQNVPYCARGLQALVTATIGTGIEPKSKGRHADVLDALWAQQVEVMDADGLFDFYGQQAAAYRAMEQDGEVLLRRRRRRPDDGLPVPLQIQVLEIDWLDSAKTMSLANGGRIINGIEYDVLGRVRAYWLYAAHPGEAMRGTARLTSGPVPAADIIHLFTPQRPGQGRGITRFAPIIARVRDLMLYEDAELARKNLEARLGVLVSGDLDGLANGGSSLSSSEPGGPVWSAEKDMGPLPSGGVTQLPPGSETTLVEPKPAGGYVEYCTLNLHLVAAGIGVPYESITGDMSRVNFSSARIRQMEFRRDCEQVQWLTVVPRLCNRVWAWFVEAAVDAGKVPAGGHGVEWSTPRWDYVNPLQDINAEAQAIGLGVLTPSESLRKRGYDPEKVFAELGEDFKALEKSGALGLMRFVLSRGKDDDAASSASTTTREN